MYQSCILQFRQEAFRYQRHDSGRSFPDRGGWKKQVVYPDSERQPTQELGVICLFVIGFWFQAMCSFIHVLQKKCHKLQGGVGSFVIR